MSKSSIKIPSKGITPTQEEVKRFLHTDKLARHHQNLYYLSQILIGFATSPVHDRITDEEREGIGHYLTDIMERERYRTAFDIRAAMREMDEE